MRHFLLYFLLLNIPNFPHQKKESARPEELGLINMKGVFYVLGFGTILAMIYGCIEETMHIFKESRRKGVMISFQIVHA